MIITNSMNRVVTTPLLLLDLLLTAGLPWPTILYTILIDEIMIITGLIGALVTSSYKVRPSSCLYVHFRGADSIYSGDTSSSACSPSSGSHGR